MTEKELQAHDHVRWRNWSRAIALYDYVLSNPPFTQPLNNRAVRDRQITCLIGRCESSIELYKYETCLSDARKVLTMLGEQQSDCIASISRARRWLVHSLLKLKKYTEAEQILRDWHIELSAQPLFTDICKTIERYKTLVHMFSNNNKPATKISYARLEEEMSLLDTKLDHWATNNLPFDKFNKQLSHKTAKKKDIPSFSGNGSGTNSSSGLNQPNSSCIDSVNIQRTTEMLSNMKVSGNKTALENQVDKLNQFTCSYCAIIFNSRNDLKQHCQTEAHQNLIMSDEGRDWKCRPPPRGYTLDAYSLCESWSELQTCHYGNQCVEAHGTEELNEWKERFEYRRMRVQKAWEKELYGKSYTEEILDRWIQSLAPEKVMCEKIEDIDVVCEQDLVTSICSKPSKREWIFVINTIGRHLKAVVLLQDAHRNHFQIKSIELPNSQEEIKLKNNQEWILKQSSTSTNSLNNFSSEREEINKIENELSTQTIDKTPLKYQIVVEFQTEIYGTFRQAICFDFGSEPLLVQHICVDVLPVNDAEKIEEIKRDIINSSATRWDASNTNLIKYEPNANSHLKTETYLKEQKHITDLMDRYPCPRAQTFTLTQSTILEKRLTQNNYRSRIHELLYVEEIARYEQIARFNLSTKLAIKSNYMLTPAGMATSTTKYSLTGELFGMMFLGKDISEDTSAGRLILSNCVSVYISLFEESPNKTSKRNVYEALIEDKSKNVIYLKLSTKCVDDLKLKVDTEIHVDIQFQLNRISYCEWHSAVDKITDFKIIFPPTDNEPNIPWTPKKQWTDGCELKLNIKQREAVNAITTSLSIKLPPILLIGPFGTGKTYTLAQAIKQLLAQSEAKILICTHSNSAADLYIKEYLHPWIENGLEEATPLRVYYHKRWVATVNSVVQKYCIIDSSGNFRRPSVEDIMKHRIVVVTLNISMELANLDLPKGYFTHIFLDEAAQAMECEAIMPLALANENTRIVLAGDHMQMSPELFSLFAKERKLHISLLERLYDHYPSTFSCKILLCENYRAHEAIIKFTSELFYEQKLVASGKQPRHDKFYPLTFFTTRGEDIQDKNSTAFYNNAEVYEVVERVFELRKKWPTSWGKLNDSSIGIMTPYADQVYRIRSELRKRRMGGIDVERVLNVQGKQFRVVFLSTVRTRKTCVSNGINGNAGMPIQPITPNEDTDFGFLSNSKLLNTAITRAQSLVAVVGDPVALCSIGRCRKVWERFIEICSDNNSLFGITMWELRTQLDGVELKRGYVLNPLAPEFVPRALQPESYLHDQTTMYFTMAGMTNNMHQIGPHNGPFPVPSVLGPPPGLLMGPGQFQPQHPTNMGNQPIPHMYGPHAAAAAAYNAVAAAAAAMINQNMIANKAMHNYSNHPNHMPLRVLGPPQTSGNNQQTPPAGPLIGVQQFNTRAPPPPPPINPMHPMGQPPASYMAWHAQQSVRPSPPGTFSGNANSQPAAMPINQSSNANLWGPPPQTNPWSVLSKPNQMPPNLSNNNGVGGNRQIPPQQPGQQSIRGNNIALPPPQPSAASLQLKLHNPQQLRNNSNDLGYMNNKGLFNKQHPGQQTTQQPPPPPAPLNFSNFGCNVPPNQLSLINPRNIGNNGSGAPGNGPISPLDTFMQRPPNSAAAVAAQNNFFATNNIPSGLKDKEFSLLNNMQMPPPPPNMNTANMFPNTVLNNAAVNNNNNSSKQQSPTQFRFPQFHEHASILPQNMSIYEMAFEPKEIQYKWYLKLLDMQGPEAAAKYTDALRHVNILLQQNQNSNMKPMQHVPNAMNPINRDIMQQQMMTYQQQQQFQHSQQQQQQQLVQSRYGLPYTGGGGIIPSLTNHVQPTLNNLAGTLSNNVNSNDEMPNLESSLNFNHQIDLAFNSIINGNEISQPILRDLFGVNNNSRMNNSSNVSTSANNSLNSTNNIQPVANMNNGCELLLHTGVQQASNNKLFGGANGGNSGLAMGVLDNSDTDNLINLPKNDLLTAPTNLFSIPGLPPTNSASSIHQSITQQHDENTIANMSDVFLGNNTMFRKDVQLPSNVVDPGSTSINSVPLYRRQGIALSNGHEGLDTMVNSTRTMINNTLNLNASENLLSGGTNDILTGLGTGAASNLIEALFQTNSHQEIQQKQQHQEHQQQIHQEQHQYQSHKLYNHFNHTSLKITNITHTDIQIDSNSFVNNPIDGTGCQHSSTTTDTISNSVQHNIITNHNDTGRNATYAAVLSHGHHQQQQDRTNNQDMGCNDGFNTDGVNLIPGQAVNLRRDDNPNATNLNGGEKDIFAALRELGQGTNGFYNYFQ